MVAPHIHDEVLYIKSSGRMLDLLHYPIYVTLYKVYGYEYNTGYRDYGDYGTPLFKKQLGFITKWQRG